MAVSAIGDILLNSKPYLIQRKTYKVSESPKSYPRTYTNNQPAERHGDNWTYWNQSDWIGDSQNDWVSDGPFSAGWGIDLSIQGQVQVAKQLAQTQADASNAAGYVCFAAGTSRLWFIGKTNGTGYHTTDGTNWTTAANVLAAGPVLPTSVADYKGTYYVGASDGKLYTNAGGATFSAVAGPLGTASYVLGAYKGNLYVGYANAVYTYNGSAFTQVFTGFIDGTPQFGAVGGSVLYFLTPGPQARLYMTDSNQLHQLVTMGSDFSPKAMVYSEMLMIFGAVTDDSGTAGQVHRLDNKGLIPIYQVGDSTGDYGIRSALLYGNKVYWGANTKTGLGVYDPSLDIFQDIQCGFYVGSVVTSVSGVVNGIAQFNNILFCGIQSNGIYKQTTPGTYSFDSSLFDGNTKNINKLWGYAEIKHTSLASGQTVTLNTLKDGTTPDSWGTNSTAGTTSVIISGPSNYKSPYLQYRISGTANGTALSILDVSLAYIEVSDNPKREWDMVLVLEGGVGSQYQIMRDGSANARDAVTMFSELNALWNTKTTFDDIDGTQYNVVMKVPQANLDDMIKDVQNGSVVDSVFFYRIHLTQL